MPNSTISAFSTIIPSDNDLLMLAQAGIANYKISRGSFIKNNSINVRDREYGAKGDTQTVTDGSMTSGSAILTSNTANFVASDVGKTVCVSNAKVNGVGLTATVASYQSSSQITLSVPATTTVNNTIVQWGSDDTVALQNALLAAQASPYKRLYIPQGTYFVNISSGVLLNVSDNTMVFGDGVGRTIIQFVNNIVLSGTVYSVLYGGRYNQIRDMSIFCGNNMSGAFISSATVVSGGLGYNVNDIITMPIIFDGAGGNIAPSLKVTSVTGGGVVATVSVQNQGSLASIPTTPVFQASTSGSGNGASFILTAGTGYAWTGVAANAGSFYGTIERIEVAFAYGGTTGGGSGIGLLQFWNTVEQTTALGTTVAAGSWVECFPTSMSGVYAGRHLDVDPNVNTVLLAQPQAVGSGYAIGDTITLTGGTSTQQGVLMVTAIQTISGTINNGGAGYSLNDILTISGGTVNSGGTAAQFKVTSIASGVVNGITLQTTGTYTVSPGTTNVTTTGGTGTGCTLNITYGVTQFGTYGCTSASSIQASGSGYAVGDVLEISNPTSGAMPTFVSVTSVTNGAVTGVGVLMAGDFSSPPVNPVSTITITGSGTACTLNLNYNISGNPVGVALVPGQYTGKLPTEPVAQGSTSGIGSGCTMNVFFNPDKIVVQAVTQRSFTAAFTNSHNASVTVNLLSDGRGYHEVNDCLIRDGRYSSGISFACAANRFIGNRINNCGDLSTQHGFYDQGGSNLYIGNHVEGVSGYSYHLHKSTPNFDASGCKLDQNTSIDPGAGHLIIDNAASPNQITGPNNYQANPEVPLGGSLVRNVEISGNLFRRSNQSVTSIGANIAINNKISAIIQGNIIEDGTGNAGLSWISVSGDNTKVIGNIFRCLNANLFNNTSAVTLNGNYIICESNTFETFSGGQLVTVNGSYCSVRGNIGTLNASYAAIPFGLNGNNAELSENIVLGGSTSGVQKVISVNASGFRIHNNDFTGMPSNWYVAQLSNTYTGSIYNNSWTGSNGLRLQATSPQYGVNIYNNEGAVVYGGNVGDNLTRAAGRLYHGQTPATVFLTSGLCVKYDTAANFVPCTINDTIFVGISPTPTSGPASDWVAIVAQPGSEYPSALVDGSWSIGNIGILSTTSSGKIHDSGSKYIPNTVTAVGVGVAVGGSNYNVNDTITLAGGTFTTATVLVVTSVSGNVVTGVAIQSGGVYTGTPTNQVSQGSTSGAGVGAKFNLTYGSPSCVRFLDSGGGPGASTVLLIKTI